MGCQSYHPGFSPRFQSVYGRTKRKRSLVVVLVEHGESVDKVGIALGISLFALEVLWITCGKNLGFSTALDTTAFFPHWGRLYPDCTATFSTVIGLFSTVLWRAKIHKTLGLGNDGWSLRAVRRINHSPRRICPTTVVGQASCRADQISESDRRIYERWNRLG